MTPFGERVRQLRRERGLGFGRLTMLDADSDHGADVLILRNGDLLVLANTGTAPVPLPAGAAPLLASGPLTPDGAVPPDTTVWAG